MKLGLWDDEKGAWLGATTYAPSQIGTAYSWRLVASGITPPVGQSVQFLASFTGALTTDWYVDEAVLTPAGTPPVVPRQ